MDGLAVSGSRVAITGTFSESVLIKSAAAGALEIASNGADIYLAPWDLNGEHPQLRGFGGPNSDIATRIVADGDDLLLAGNFIEHTTIGELEFTDHATGAYVVRVSDERLSRELTITGQKYEDIADMVVLPGRMLAVTGSFYGSLFAGPLTELTGPTKKSDTYTIRVALANPSSTVHPRG